MPDTDAQAAEPVEGAGQTAAPVVAAQEPADAASEGVQGAPDAVPQPVQAAVEEVPDGPDPVAEPEVPWPWVGVGGALLLAALAAFLARGRTRGVLKDDSLRADEDVLSQAAPAPSEAPVGIGAQLRSRLERTRSAFRSGLDALLGRETIDEEALEALEDALLLADVGVPTAERLVGAVRTRLAGAPTDADSLRSTLREEMLALVTSVAVDEVVPRPVDEGPFVLLVVGVNGSGKTTSIGKLAARFGKEGHRVVMGAADTFRAAAADQLAVWAERASCRIVRQDEGADPASVAFAAAEAALSDGADVLLVDTAGRLQNARPLMEQLTKIKRVLGKKVAGAPHETWLVIDGTMGQNALAQARAFHEATPLTGVIVTKLDGTAKGGMVLAIAQELGLPVRFIGVGEQVDDLRPFDPEAFVDALL